MTTRKFYKTTFTITVLHEENGYYPDDLGVVHHDITEGDYSGTFEQNETVELNGRQATGELQKMSSDPGWFKLDEDGNDTEE